MLRISYRVERAEGETREEVIATGQQEAAQMGQGGSGGGGERSSDSAYLSPQVSSSPRGHHLALVRNVDSQAQLRAAEPEAAVCGP